MDFNQKSSAEKCREALLYQGKQFLLTCDGDWGVPSLPDHVSLSPEVEKAVEELKLVDVCQKVWLRVKQEAVRLAVEFSADDWAVCLELCPKIMQRAHCACMHTWQSSGRNNRRCACQCRTWSSWMAGTPCKAKTPWPGVARRDGNPSTTPSCS